MKPRINRATAELFVPMFELTEAAQATRRSNWWEGFVFGIFAGIQIGVVGITVLSLVARHMGWV